MNVMVIDEAAEYRLLAACIDEPNAIRGITENLFTGTRVELFKAMQKAYTQYSGEITSEGVERFYGQRLPPQLEMSRGARPSAIVEHLANLATKRHLLRLSDRLAQLATVDYVDKNLVQQTLQMPPLVVKDDTHVDTGIREFSADLSLKLSKNYQFHSTGLPFLDGMLGGEWPRKGLTLIAGPSGGAKTALVVHSMIQMARNGLPVFMASLEMSKAALISRAVANLSRIDSMKIRRGDLTKEELDKVNDVLRYVHSLPMYISEEPELTATDIAYLVKSHKDRYGIKAFFVDYVQIVARSGNANSFEELGAIAQTLRNVAKNEDLSGVAISQLNRSHEGLDSLQGSGRLGNIPDTVIHISMEQQNDDCRVATLDFFKNREGPLGTSNALYLPKYLAFE